MSRAIDDPKKVIKVVNNVYYEGLHNVNTLNLFSLDDDALSYDNILKNQLEDKKLKQIGDKLNQNKLVNSNYVIHDKAKLLMYLKANNSQNSTGKIVIPNVLKQKFLKAAHQPHFGAQKTSDILSRHYFWKKMFIDVQNFCKSCHECLLNKFKPTQTKPKF